QLLEARRSMENVIRLNPKNIMALLVIADSYKEVNNFEKAFAYAERARLIDPRNLTVREELLEYKEAYEKFRKSK
ncbi:MAG: hypothetical protein VST68_03820, partial [Nitrospirota bacterium]|nr:hypothetical protein [Nitrospirota bacterium]